MASDPQDFTGCLNAIMAGDPSTLTNAATAFDQAGRQTQGTCDNASGGASKITNSWTGPAHDAFESSTKAVLTVGQTTAHNAKACKSPLDDASGALTTAQSQIQKLQQDYQ